MRKVLATAAVWAGLLVTSVGAAPAAEEPTNPLVALVASTGPLALVDVLLLAGANAGSPAVVTLGYAGMAIAPLLEGGGQLYAGDPDRALIVSAGALGTSICGAGLGYFVGSAFKLNDWTMPAVGWALGANLYGIFAGADAFATSTRRSVASGPFRDLVSWGGFPRERGMGALVGLGGPGIAYRGFISPELGFQAGANLVWGNAGASAGGQFLYSPVHREGQRLYGFLGGAFVSMSGQAALVPSVGVGASTQFGEHVTVYLDNSFLMPINLTQTSQLIPATVYPQLGVLFDW